MPSKHSTTLTALPDVFSGGVSPISSTSLWPPNLWFEYDAIDQKRFDFGGTQVYADTGIFLHDDLVRHLCHYILDQVPDEGLQEAGDTLAHIYKFYVERARDLKLPQMHTVETASFGKSYDRDPLYITEE